MALDASHRIRTPKRDSIMLTRRIALMGTAIAALMVTVPALTDDLKLPRERVELVAARTSSADII
jgi:hypothetical protein